jgi:SAM domain (Sterile alpha motif)
MERYAGHLEQAGIRSAADAARLQRQDLVALGITLAGHQKRILNGAAALRIPSSSASFTLPPQPPDASFVWRHLSDGPTEADALTCDFRQNCFDPKQGTVKTRPYVYRLFRDLHACRLSPSGATGNDTRNDYFGT